MSQSYSRKTNNTEKEQPASMCVDSNPTIDVIRSRGNISLKSGLQQDTLFFISIAVVQRYSICT